MSRFARFNIVGVAGFMLQWIVLAVLMKIGLHYLPATAIAVEAALLHNFAWHERWTWRDRPRTGSIGWRLLRFHAANGLSSITGHAVGMAFLVQMCEVPPLVANLPTVLGLSLVTYRLGDRLVFRIGSIQDEAGAKHSSAAIWSRVCTPVNTGGDR